jgi:DnaK suppressor protein
MIVSILQLMGFPMAKPVHSRAGEAPPEGPSKGSSGATGTTDQEQTRSARRQEVKAKPGKNSKATAAPSKAPATGKPKGKPAVKPAATVSKPVAKKPAKPLHKAAPAKPVAKSAPVKSTKAAKPATKAAAPAKKVPAKPVAKATTTASKPQAVPVPKPRAATSPVPKPASKAPAKPMPTTVSPKTKTPAASVAPVEKTTPVPVAPAAAPAKAGRPSSRLAQLTVPSMAQSVASTAAKASYTQSTPSPVIVPVLPSSIKKDPKLANNWKTTPPGDLTDAELMAMPDSEYMNTVQMASFRLKLAKLKLDILNSAGETTEHLREDTSVVPDPADRATIEEEHALELRTRDRERKLLKKIEQSIARIDAGDYGYCDETGEPIGVGRLLARPTATLSLEAQQRRELKQKMFGD